MTINRTEVDRLVRDKIPEMLRANNMIVHDRIMEQAEYLQRLKDKIVEEAKEVADASALPEITEELADVLEVVLAIAKANGIPIGDVEKYRILKHSERGGFEGQVYVSYVESEAESD